MISEEQYSHYFLKFLMYGEGIVVNIGVGAFGMVCPTIFLRSLAPWFAKSNVLEHPVTHLMTRMFSTVLILLGLIEFSLIHYCTSSLDYKKDGTRKTILKYLVSMFCAMDMFHTLAFLIYHIPYGSSTDASAIGNIYGSMFLFTTRMIYLWINSKNSTRQNKEN